MGQLQGNGYSGFNESFLYNIYRWIYSVQLTINPVPLVEVVSLRALQPSSLDLDYCRTKVNAEVPEASGFKSFIKQNGLITLSQLVFVVLK